MIRAQAGIVWSIVFVLFVVGIQTVSGQKVVDKTVATVSDGVKTELITLSDLRWHLALVRGVNINPPSSADLNAALRALVENRIFALEAKRLPRNPPSKEEIAAEIKKIVDSFPSPAEFESRLRLVGFSSIDDESFRQIISDRIAIVKYLDFRFKSFIVITANDEAKYYREVFVPEFRREFPGLLMPTLDEKRATIREKLIEQRVANDIETFLEEAKQRVKIVYLSQV